MPPEDWTRTEALFHELVELAPGERRERLDEISGSDPALGSELEALLEAHDEAGTLDRLADEVVPGLAAASEADRSGSLVGSTIGPYEIEELVGRGGMGEVYRARDPRLDRHVALKFLPPWLGRDPAARERFLVEAKIASSLEHPNVCGLLHLGETTDGRLYLVMPYYEGESLKKRLERGGLPPAEAVLLGLQVAWGLGAAHRRDIVHRDIKPANLFLTNDGDVRILDFGVAKLADVDLTRTGQMPGTMSYMSPEQRAGGVVDERSDLWSLGAVLHEAVTGLRPVDSRLEPSFETSAPAGLVAVVTRLLAPDPDDRYPDARSLAEDLAILADGSDALRADPAPEAKRFLAELKRRRVFQVAALYGVVGFGIIEVADAVFPHVGLPPWATTLVVWLVPLGFPVALVLAWAFETTPGGGIRRTRSVRPAILDAIAAQPVRRRWPIGLAGAAGGALLVVGAWLALGDRVERLLPGSVQPRVTAAGQAVAVLPFHVVGAADSDLWREGPVHLLSDAVGAVDGLRTIDPMLLMTAWEERFGETGSAPDLQSALGVAAKYGARYALTGTAVGDDRSVVLTARVHDLSSGEERGPVRSQASVDSVTRIVSQLTLALLREGLLPSDSAASLDLSRAATNSLPAFQAYLQGERAYRRGRFEDAAQHFAHAVEIDSTFARAMFRAANAFSWTNNWDRYFEFRARAAGLAAELSPRDSVLYTAWDGTSAAIPVLERFTREYPDDLDGWAQLGDAYYHSGGTLLYPTDSYRRAWAEARALGPMHVEPYVHLFEDAFARRDRQEVAALLDDYSRITPGESPCPGIRLTFELTWGEASVRDSLARQARTLPFEQLHCAWTTLATADVTTRVAEERGLALGASAPLPNLTPEARLFRILQARVMRGELDAARDMLASDLTEFVDPLWPAHHALMFHLNVFPDSASVGEAVRELNAAPLVDPVSGMLRTFVTLQPHAVAFWLGALDVNGKRWGAVDGWVDAMRIAADSLRVLAAAGSDTAESRLLLADAEEASLLAEGLGFLAALHRGEPIDGSRFDAVLAALRQPAWRESAFLRFEAGKEFLRRGDPSAAETYLATFIPYEWLQYVPAQYHLGRVYEALGEEERAREHYRIFVEWWETADLELQPWRDQGLEALRRLAPDS